MADMPQMQEHFAAPPGMAGRKKRRSNLLRANSTT